MREKLETILFMAETAESKQVYFAANHLYAQALKKISSASKTQERDKKIKFLKEKIRETGKKIKMQTFSYKMEGTSVNNISERYSKLLAVDDPEEAIQGYARGIQIFPVSIVRKASAENRPVIADIVSGHLQDKKGDHLNPERGDGDMYFWSLYNKMLAAYTIRDIVVVAELLTASGKFSKENLLAYLKTKESFLEPSERKKLNRCLERHFDKDFISSVHILVPTFEGMFLRLSSASSEVLSDISHRASKEGVHTKTRTLGGDFLDNPEAVALWDEDFCSFLKALLFSETGIRLRHRVCHGEINAGECDEQASLILIFIFLHVLSRLKKASVNL